MRVIPLGSLAGSLFPFLTGLAFEDRRLARRLYTQLPLIMTAEVALTAAAILLYALDLSLSADLKPFSDLRVLLALGLAQTAVVYLIYLRCYSRRKGSRTAVADSGMASRPRAALLTSH